MPHYKIARITRRKLEEVDRVVIGGVVARDRSHAVKLASKRPQRPDEVFACYCVKHPHEKQIVVDWQRKYEKDLADFNLLMEAIMASRVLVTREPSS